MRCAFVGLSFTYSFHNNLSNHKIESDSVTKGLAEYAWINYNYLACSYINNVRVSLNNGRHINIDSAHSLSMT